MFSFLGTPSEAPGDDFFRGNVIYKLELRVEPPEAEEINAGHRPYVRSQLNEEGKKEYKSVGVKIKGAAGSSRDFNDKPALTFNVDKYRKKQLFHSLDKFHLNNSVQDESYLNEWYAWRVFEECGYPASRVAHATLKINDKPEGLYVLKEGFNRRWLKRHYKDSEGNLYDGGFLQDISAPLEKDEGEGVDDRSDLAALYNATQIEDPQERRKRLEELLDIPVFLKFMAVERMLCHWDGYTVGINNYRIYFDPQTHKAMFVPHGLDQILGIVDMGLFDHSDACIAAAVLENTEWRREYRKVLKELLPALTSPQLMRECDEKIALLRSYFQQQSDEAAAAYDEMSNNWKSQLEARVAALQELVEQPEPAPLEFDETNRISLTDWYQASEVESVRMDAVRLDEQERNTLLISVAEAACVASWRQRVLLAKGNYVLTVLCKTEDVVPLEESPNRAGAVRISKSEPLETLVGSRDWSEIRFPFAVFEDQRQVEFVLELRAAQGTIWFDSDSLVLERLE